MSYANKLTPQRVTLGMDNANCMRAIEEWLHRDAPIDIRLCKAKTKGLRCIICDIDPNKKPDGVYWVSWVLQYCSVKVDTKDIGPYAQGDK